jgi:hypothetical protein
MFKFILKMTATILFGIVIAKIVDLVGYEHIDFVEISLLALIYIELLLRGEDNDKSK